MIVADFRISKSLKDYALRKTQKLKILTFQKRKAIVLKQHRSMDCVLATKMKHGKSKRSLMQPAKAKLARTQS